MKSKFIIALFCVAIAYGDDIPADFGTMVQQAPMPLDTAPQVPFAPKFAVDVLCGFSFATMAGTEIDNTVRAYETEAEYRNTGNASILFSYYLNQHVSLGTGAGFWGKGYKMLIASADGSVMYYGRPIRVSAELYRSLEVDFYEFPIFATLHTAHILESVNLFCLFGISFGKVATAMERYYQSETHVEVTGKESSDESDISNTDLMSDNVITNDSTGATVHYRYRDFYQTYDISYLISAGIEKQLVEKVGAYLSVSYMHGLVNFNNLSANAAEELKNSSGYSFNATRTVNAYFRTISADLGLRVYF